ncbi:hypothetical protein CS063_07170 [Sporanaerobium hydrogeniformans]|uniref:Uncharacterized protein n=1 Tax=Sporanaerobium hydrogeniformans TaxID=3072179 RepID=A0AC61DCR7_9FIRM|nr:hypothetical protein [Sporanaerobium hydrogeniformans]PHV71104.1 hypothetical protein CS063_07170 [Sporanaerobium hydrogeniformans]
MFKKITLIFFIFLLLGTMLLYPQLCIEAASSGLLLWFNKVLPSLLPFIILVNLLMGSDVLGKLQFTMNKWTQRLWHLPGGSLLAFILGLIAGYPMGAKVTKELYQQNYLSLSEAQKVLCFANNCGPLFIVGTVGTLLLQNTHLGYFLLFIHFLSAFLISICLRRFPARASSFKRNHHDTQSSSSFSNLFNEAVKNGMDTIVYVGAYIIFFSVLVSLFITVLPAFISPYHLQLSSSQLLFLSGLLELSNGVSGLCQSALPPATSLPLIAFILGFGGICILFQTSYILEKVPFSLVPYFFYKLAQGFISFLLTKCLYPLWQWQVEKTPFYLPVYWLGALLLFIIFLAGNTQRLVSKPILFATKNIHLKH